MCFISSCCALTFVFFQYSGTTEEATDDDQITGAEVVDSHQSETIVSPVLTAETEPSAAKTTPSIIPAAGVDDKPIIVSETSEPIAEPDTQVADSNQKSNENGTPPMAIIPTTPDSVFNDSHSHLDRSDVESTSGYV